jgi:hypothetical protein
MSIRASISTELKPGHFTRPKKIEVGNTWYYGIWMHDAEIQLVTLACAVVDGGFATYSRTRFASIGSAIDLSRGARICLQAASPSFRDPAKYPE